MERDRKQMTDALRAAEGSEESGLDVLVKDTLIYFHYKTGAELRHDSGKLQMNTLRWQNIGSDGHKRDEDEL